MEKFTNIFSIIVFWLEKLLGLVSRIASFQNLTTQELTIFNKLGSIDGYEHICRQELWSIFPTPYLPKPSPKSASRSKNLTPMTAVTPAPRPEKRIATPSS